MGDYSFPAWSAPFVGAGVGFVLGLQIYLRSDRASPHEWEFIGGAAFGAFAGLIVYFLDPRPRHRPTHEDVESKEPAKTEVQIQAFEPHGSSPRPANPIDTIPRRALQRSENSVSTFVGRFLALLSILVCTIPFIGLGLSLAAFLSNRDSRGWERIVSIIALCVSVPITTGFAVLLLLTRDT
jgi:hypothetical protein